MSSPSSPTTPRRRLSSRRGSHGQINLNPNRLSSSTLTIVKVVPNANSEPNNAFANANHSTISLKDPPGPGQRRPHRRIGSNEMARGRPVEGAGGSPRMSFAFSTFGPARPNQSDTRGVRTPSPSSSAPSSPSRLRPSSPGASRGSTSGYAAPKPKLTPEQLYELAHHATNPKHFPATSPPTQRTQHSSSPLGGTPSASSGISTSTVPATFTPLHPSVYLPFMDRSMEVKALIESAPTRKLFALLKQTFPKNNPTGLVATNPDPKSLSHPSSSSSTESLLGDLKIPAHPTAWSYANLIAFLTSTSRDQVPDALWVAKVRSCILSHSELIWERVKGALGVPPELDVDFDPEMEMNADVFESSESESESDIDKEDNVVRTPGSVNTPKTDDMEDGGMRARGYWEGWDAVVDSPVNDRGSFPSSALSSSYSMSPSMELKDPMPLNAAAAILHARHYGADFAPVSGETTASPTPVQRESRSPTHQDIELPEIVEQLPTPTASFDEGQMKRHGKSNSRSSPLILSPSHSVSSSIGSPSLHPPPLSIPASLADSSTAGGTNALGNIMEGAEEEEEEGENNEGQEKKNNDDGTAKDSAEPTIDPAQIHGLRISLSSLPSSPVISNSSAASSPVFAYHRPLSQSLSRANSLSQARKDANRLSWGSIGSGANLSRSQSYSSDHSPYGYTVGAGGSRRGSASGYDSEGGGYDPVGDRAPGNPLFPSNFARLATGPTLVANNPSLRSPPLPPQSKYPHFNRRGSNTSGVSATSNDYAITLGSGSSAVGETR
ncbi:hypothetical protein BT96DRAFT_919842 [Gymnopus androsaceus JB14]|uniref:Uncharacterized protein n=1 Tax=Gymnopus androsaceus JB14 TaxID=1447944 RepID=A0A6A4HTA1_9AGAR|nr:hypothetical protein BT96DRAFT_919842 [Gymnopus androsaceus JB14]